MRCKAGVEDQSGGWGWGDGGEAACTLGGELGL